MGAGKDGGDGAGKEAAAAAEPPQPVVLRMVLHCEGCAKKVKKSIHRMPGVASVVADAAANTVVVAGTADAAALKARIESKTKKPVEIVSSGSGGAAKNKPPPAEPKKNPDKEGGEQKNKSPDMGGASADSKGDKAAAQPQPQPQPKEEEKGKKQLPEEKKPVQETTALLKIRLHCDGCADRIRRRIYKIKGVKDVILEGNAKDEVKVVGTMDVPAMVTYLNEKLNRTVELAAPGKKYTGEEAKKDKTGDGDMKKDKSAAAGDNAHKGDKGKGIEVAGSSMASAAASMAPASAMASTHHVSPYGYGHVAYPPPPQGPPPGYYNSYNADGAGYAVPYYQQPRADAGSYYNQPPTSTDAGSYYQHQPRGDAGLGSYYQHQPSADAHGGSYYQHQPGGYDQHPNPQAYPFDTAPPPQMFSDENPNSCSVM